MQHDNKWIVAQVIDRKSATVSDTSHKTINHTTECPAHCSPYSYSLVGQRFGGRQQLEDGAAERAVEPDK